MSAQTCREAKTLPACRVMSVIPTCGSPRTPSTWSGPRRCARTARFGGECLAAALEREEPWGVWGGEIIERGTIVARKRPRGRPRKNPSRPGSRASRR